MGGRSSKHAVGRAKNLNDWFKSHYSRGGIFEVDGPSGFEQIRDTLVHQATGVEVWQDAIDLTDASEEPVLIFHYTTRELLQALTDESKDAEEVCLSLDVIGPQTALYSRNGKGLYGTVHGPDDFGTMAAILDNFHTIADGTRTAIPDDVESYPERVKYCIPMLVPTAKASNVESQPTHTPAESSASRGTECSAWHCTQEGGLPEPGTVARDIWVVRMEDALEDVRAARARLLATLRHRAQVIEGRFGSSHVHTLAAQERLGTSLRQRGQLAEAKLLLRQVLRVRERSLAAEDPDTVRSLSEMASCLEAMGQRKEAELLYRRALYASEQGLGKEHPQTLEALNSLAQCLKDCGQATDALPMYRRALETCERTLGREDPQTFVAVNHLALCLRAAGQKQDAAQLYRRALEVSEMILGREHPHTLDTVNQLAGCLQPRYAEPLYRRALEVSERTLGQLHPTTVASLTGLAGCLKAEGKEVGPLLARGDCPQSERITGREPSLDDEFAV